MRIWQDYRRVMASLLLLGLLAEPLPARAEEPSGTYQAQGVAPNGKSYAGIVEILPQGKGAHLAWQLEGGARYLGLGLRLDNVLGAVYWPLQVKSNGIGVVIYRIDGGRLNGDWMILQGPRDQVGEEELEGPPELEGRFEIVRGVNPGGASGYKGHVEISRRGDVYYFRWFTPTASAVADPDIITALGKVYVPFTASTLAQAAAIASINASEELLARTDSVVAERARVSAALRDVGYDLPESQANFVWLPLGPEHTGDFVEQAANARVLVRPYGTDGVRVTIGAPHENDTFLAFATGWIQDKNLERETT